MNRTIFILPASRSCACGWSESNVSPMSYLFGHIKTFVVIPMLIASKSATVDVFSTANKNVFFERRFLDWKCAPLKFHWPISFRTNAIASATL